MDKVLVHRMNEKCNMLYKTFAFFRIYPCDVLKTQFFSNMTKIIRFIRQLFL